MDFLRKFSRYLTNEFLFSKTSSFRVEYLSILVSSLSTMYQRTADFMVVMYLAMVVVIVVQVEVVVVGVMMVGVVAGIW